MRLSNGFRQVVVLALLLSPAGVRATTYVMMSDADLADRAARIVRGRIDGVRSADGRAALEYRVAVERTIQGEDVSELVVRVPGNPHPTHGPALRVWGAPAFAADQRVLLFLVPNADGTERIVHLALGAFRVVADGERSLAVRTIRDAREAGSIGTRATNAERYGARDLARFEEWLAHRAARSPDYFVDDRAAAAPQPGEAVVADAAEAWGEIRWFQFDGRRALRNVRWSSDSFGQPGLPGAGHREFRSALRAWTRHRGSTIRYGYDGLTEATGGLETFDGVNAILFQWALDEPFECGVGGLLGMGGAWYDDADFGTYRGRHYYRIVEADIVMNAGIECFFADSPDGERAAHEVFAHELGHTLGLGHSCGDEDAGGCTSTRENEAIMRAFAHDDGRGAALKAYDRAAIRGLYRGKGISDAECAAR